MDSGQTISDELYDQLYKSFYSYRDHAWSTYSHLHPSLVAWYWTRSVQIEQAYGHKIPALMALHIPIQECYTAWMNRSGLDWNGARNEGVCAGELNSGFFASVIERGDVKAIVFGHDHVNDYSIEYCGVRLCGSSTLSPLGYWSENNAGAYKGKTISDVLDMTIDEAVEFFKNIPSIAPKL